MAVLLDLDAGRVLEDALVGVTPSERPPPHDVEAEQAALGAGLLSADALAIVLEQLDEGDFYRPAHRTVYAVMVALHARGDPADVVTIGAELDRRRSLHDVGGAPFLHTLVASVPTVAGVGQYAARVAELARARRVIDVGHQLVQVGHEEPQHADRAVALARQVLERVGKHQDSATYADAAALEAAWLEFLDTGGAEGAVSWGLVDLDAVTGGMRRGELVLLAGRTGMGKSSLGLQVAEDTARLGGHAVIASYEMTLPQIQAHRLAAEARIDLRLALRLDALDQAGVAQALERLRSRRIEVVSDALDATGLSARLVDIHARDPIDLVVVDYLQLVPPAQVSHSREQDVAGISRSLKRLALRFQVPVLALCQLNREPAARADKEPRLTDLRESGSLENDADQVVLLHRPDYYDPDSSRKGEADLIVAKQRMGPTDTVTVVWDGPRAVFRNMVPFLRSIR